MPLPIAHGLIGASVVAAFHSRPLGRRNWMNLSLGALLGVFPDFDYLLNWVRFQGRGWHHDFTHSILFAALMGWVAAAIVRRICWKDAAVYGAAMLSHPLLDYVFTQSRGVELFWPFSNARHKLGVAAPIVYAWRDDSIVGMIVDIARLCAVETVAGASVLLLILLLRKACNLRPDSLVKKRGRC
jgi:LexA-binding, inner membrane-associated putative hydrolase